MAWTYSLTDGTTTVALASGDYIPTVGGFTAPPPRRRMAMGGSNLFRHGSDIVARRYENRTVTLRLRISATDQDTLISDINAIQGLLERAAEFSTFGLGAQVKLNRQWDTATNTTVFYVLEGVLDFGATELDQVHLQQDMIFDARLILLCEPFAYGLEESIENFVADPGFEVAGTALADWTESKTATGTTARDTGAKKDGAASLKLVMTNSGGSGEVIERSQSLADVDAAEVWSFQCWVRVDALSNCKVVMEIDYNTGTDVEVSTTTVNASSFVKLTSNNNTVPGSVTSATLRLRLESTAGSATGTVYIDNVIAVQAAAVPTAWASSHAVYNHYADDAQASTNYLDVYDIPGDVPALLQVKATENEAHTAFWLGARHAGRQTDAGIFHEGEDFGTWASEPSDGSPSGGNYGETGQGVIFDAASSGSATAASTVTVAHATSTSSDRLIIVGVSTFSSQANTAYRIPSGVTYAGAAMTSIGSITDASPAQHTVSLWYRIAPATGTNNIIATFPANFSDCVVGGTSFLNVHQTAPVGTMASANGSSTAPSVDVTAAPSGIVIDTVVGDINGTLSVGTSQTSRWNIQTTNGYIRGGGSTELATSTSVTMSWTLGSSQRWAIAAVEVLPLATSITTQASNPLIQAKTVSSPPTGLYRVLTRARRSGTAVEQYVGIGYSYGAITSDPTVQANYQAMVGSAYAIYDLGTLTIPPVVTPANATPADISLRLALYQDGDGSTTEVLEVDWVMLLPIDFGSVYVSKASATDVVFVNGYGSPAGVYLLNASDVVQSFPADQVGTTPEAHPDGTRLYFASDDGDADIADGWTVSITYLSRYLYVS